MKTSSCLIVRTFLPLVAVILMMAGISPGAHAQCSGTITIEKVFPLSDDPIMGILTVTSSGSGLTYTHAIHATDNGVQTYTMPPIGGGPYAAVLQINGFSVPHGTSKIPGPNGFPSCLCLEVTFILMPNGCALIEIRPVCC